MDFEPYVVNGMARPHLEGNDISGKGSDKDLRVKMGTEDEESLDSFRML